MRKKSDKQPSSGASASAAALSSFSGGVWAKINFFSAVVEILQSFKVCVCACVHEHVRAHACVCPLQTWRPIAVFLSCSLPYTWYKVSHWNLVDSVELVQLIWASRLAVGIPCLSADRPPCPLTGVLDWNSGAHTCTSTFLPAVPPALSLLYRFLLWVVGIFVFSFFNTYPVAPNILHIDGFKLCGEVLYLCGLI